MHIKTILTAGTALAFSFCFAQKKMLPNRLSKTEKKDGWKLLFNGKSTSGWHTFNKTEAGAAWKISDRALYLDTTYKAAGTGGGDLVSDKEFSNFHLKYDWKISPHGNSGLIFYVKEDPKYGAAYHTGLEMQVLDNEGHSDGKITKHRAGDLYDLVKSSTEPVHPVGEWNHAEIISDNGKLSLYINGTMVVSTTLWDENWKQMVAASKFKAWQDFGVSKIGKIDLQDHGNAVWFRNIKIKEL